MRRRRIALAAIVTGALLAATFFWLSTGPTFTATSTGPTFTATSISGSVLLTSGGRAALLPGGGCDNWRTTATESPSRVTLLLEYSPITGCQASAAMGFNLVAWRHPLGKRALIDGATGKRIPYVDVRAFPRATYLPPGYRLVPGFFEGYDSAADNGWARDYAPPYVPGGPSRPSLNLVIGPDNAHGPFYLFSGGPMVTRKKAVTVRGRPASLQELWADSRFYQSPPLYPYTRDIYWQAGGLTFDVHSQSTGEHVGPPLPAAVLERFAAGLAP